MATLNVVVRMSQTGGSAVAGALGQVARIAGGFVLGQGLLQLPNLLSEAASAAADDEAAAKRLEQSLRNVGGSFDDNLKAVNDAIAAGQRLGFTDDDIRDSFQFLAAATGDSNEALRRQKLALDFARGANIPLSQASKLLGKVTADNVEVFKRMGITIGEGASEADAFAAIQAKFAGQADVYAQSSKGQMEAASIAFSEMKESLGGAILPLIGRLGALITGNLPAIQSFVDLLGQQLSVAVDLVISGFSALMTFLAPLGAALGALGDYFSSVIVDGDYLNDFLSGLPAPLRNVTALVGAFVGSLLQITDGDLQGGIEEFAKAFGRLGPKIVEQLLAVPPLLVAALRDWAVAFAGWVDEMLPLVNAKLVAFVTGLYAWIAEIVPGLVERLRGWAVAFAGWVDTALPLALEKAGTFLQGIFDWVTGTAAPRIASAVAPLIVAWVQWLGDAIPPALEKLDAFLVALIDGIGAGGDGISVAVETKWVPAFLSFAEKVAVGIGNSYPRILAAFGKLILDLEVALVRLAGRLVTALSGWITTELIPEITHQLNLFRAHIQVWFLTIAVPAMQEFGRSLMRGLAAGILDLRGLVIETAQGVAQSALDAIRDAIQPGSPSKVTTPWGESMAEGLRAGLLLRIPAVHAASTAVAAAALAPIRAAAKEIAAFGGGNASGFANKPGGGWSGPGLGGRSGGSGTGIRPIGPSAPAPADSPARLQAQGWTLNRQTGQWMPPGSAGGPSNPLDRFSSGATINGTVNVYATNLHDSLSQLAGLRRT